MGLDFNSLYNWELEKQLVLMVVRDRCLGLEMQMTLTIISDLSPAYPTDIARRSMTDLAAVLLDDLRIFRLYLVR